MLLLSVLDKPAEYEVVLDPLIRLEGHAVDVRARLEVVHYLDAETRPVHINEPLVHLLVLKDHIKDFARGHLDHCVQSQIVLAFLNDARVHFPAFEDHGGVALHRGLLFGHQIEQLLLQCLLFLEFGVVFSRVGML